MKLNYKLMTITALIITAQYSCIALPGGRVAGGGGATSRPAISAPAIATAVASPAPVVSTAAPTLATANNSANAAAGLDSSIATATKKVDDSPSISVTSSDQHKADMQDMDKVLHKISSINNKDAQDRYALKEDSLNLLFNNAVDFKNFIINHIEKDALQSLCTELINQIYVDKNVNNIDFGKTDVQTTPAVATAVTPAPTHDASATTQDPAPDATPAPDASAAS